MHDRHVFGADLAREIGISRPQLVNLLVGRFGTTPRVAQALKRWALESRAVAGDTAEVAVRGKNSRTHIRAML